jgi:hypothetical protein
MVAAGTGLGVLSTKIPLKLPVLQLRTECSGLFDENEVQVVGKRALRTISCILSPTGNRAKLGTEPLG